MSSRLSTYPVAERRLRPIYDWLDSGNNKKALQEAEKVLKKQPSLQCAKVLKCLALLRLGKDNESMEILESIRNEGPTEETTLQLMAVCYREVHKPDLICKVYESANKKEPGNEEILTNLFLSYVRIGDLKKQQNTALTLYKLKNKNQYYFWIIISILGQYNSKPAVRDDSKSHLLRLADKLVEKHAKEKKIETDQEVLIYIFILEIQGRFQDALDVLNGELGNKLELSRVINKRIELLIRMEEWAKANELLKSVLIEDIDAWNYISLYLDTIFHLGKSQMFSLDSEEGPLYEGKMFLDKLMKQNLSLKLKKRGPYLAQLEFYARLVDINHREKKLIEDAVQCLHDFMEEFSSKHSCIYDLRPYLYLTSFLDNSELFKLGVKKKFWSFTVNKSRYIDEYTMKAYIFLFEFESVLGLHEEMTPTEKLMFVNSMVKQFVLGLHFYSDLPSTEIRSNDRFLLIAIHKLYDLWVDTEQNSYLFNAIVLSHYALNHSPSNSQFKILLVKFYHLLGGCSGAHNAYISLDLKHMQLDTLGYLHVFPLLANAEYTHAKTVLYWTLKFFTNNVKESTDHITFAFKYEALTKIPEFAHIRSKLNYSSHYWQATIEKLLLDLFLAQSHSSTVECIKGMSSISKIEWNLLEDNRDFTVLWDIEYKTRNLSDSSAIHITYLQDIVFLRLRSLLLQICISFIQLGLSESEAFQELDTEYESEGNNTSNYTELKSSLHKLIFELENNLRTLQTNVPNHVSSRYIAGPPDSRLLMTVQCNYFDPILSELKFTLSLLPGEHSNKEESQNHLDATQLFLNEFLNIISNELAKCDNLTSKNLTIQLSALFVELLSLSCIVIGVCDSILKKFKQSLIKKSKRKKDSQQKSLDYLEDYDWRANIYMKFINIISSVIKNLEKALRSEEKRLKEKNLKIDLMINTNYIEDVKEVEQLLKMIQLAEENLSISYSGSFDHVTTILKQKLKYIACHKV